MTRKLKAVPDVPEEKQERIYLAGPMTGIVNYNFDAFNDAARRLRLNPNYEVFNPAESFDGVTTLPWDVYMRHDIEALLGATMIVYLEGWHGATGAKLEVTIGVALGLEIAAYVPIGEHEYDLHVQAKHPDAARETVKYLMGQNPPSSPENRSSAYKNILFEADAAVHGERGSDYGHPIKDFSKTAKMWSGLFLEKLKDGVEFTARDVPLAMNCVKMSREMNKPKRDNRVDGAGYWETLDMIDNYVQ